MSDEAPGNALIGGSEPQPAYKLYSIASIGLATFLASWLAGAVLISRNYARLGNRRAACVSILFGVLGLVLLLVAVFSIEVPPQYETYMPVAFQGIQIGVISMIAIRLQGEALSTHERKGGQLYSNWRAAGIALLLLPVVIAFLLVGGATLSTYLVPKNIKVRVDAPLVVNEGESFEIGLHARNEGDTQVTLVAVDISREYLRGIVIDSFDPPYSSSEPIAFVVSHHYDIPIDAGQEIEIVLQAHGEIPGNYYEFVSFCIDSPLTCLDYQVLTTVQ